MVFLGLIPFALRDVLRVDVGCLELGIWGDQRLVSLLMGYNALEARRKS